MVKAASSDQLLRLLASLEYDLRETEKRARLARAKEQALKDVVEGLTTLRDSDDNRFSASREWFTAFVPLSAVSL